MIRKPFLSLSSPLTLNLFLCSTRKTYRPLIPFKSDYPILYCNPAYYKVQTHRPILKKRLCYTPMFLIFLNNMLTSWSILNSGLFMLGGIAGFVANNIVLYYYGRGVGCVQVDKQMKKMYFAVPKTVSNLLLMAEFRPSLFHPVKNEHPMKVGIEGNQQILIKFDNFERELHRVEIPIENVEFQLRLTSEERRQLQRDYQRLTIMEQIKKYESRDISLGLIFEKKGLNQTIKVPLVIRGSQNMQKRYYDCLVALALGHRVEAVDISKSNLE